MKTLFIALTLALIANQAKALNVNCAANDPETQKELRKIDISVKADDPRLEKMPTDKEGEYLLVGRKEIYSDGPTKYFFEIHFSMNESEPGSSWEINRYGADGFEVASQTTLDTKFLLFSDPKVDIWCLAK